MNRTEYRQARRLCRDNGRYALRWLPKDHADIMGTVMFDHQKDHLAERADIIAYCKREGIECNPRHTAPRSAP